MDEKAEILLWDCRCRNSYLYFFEVTEDNEVIEDNENLMLF